MSMAIRSVGLAVMLSLSAVAGSAETAGPGASNPSQANGAMPLGSALGDIVKMPDLFTGSWGTFSGFVEDDKNLVPPFTPAARKHVETFKHKRDIPYAEDGCRTPGLPIAMRVGRVKFSYSPGLISIYMGFSGHSRFIKMNEKEGVTSPKYYGNSVGHWEGDTLVVESVNFVPEVTFQYGVGEPLPPEETAGTFSIGPVPGAPGAARAAGPGGPGGPPGAGPVGPPRGNPGEPAPSLLSLSAAIWGPHGEDMRMVERMRFVNPDTLQIKTTVYDNTVWTKPYEMAPRTYRRSVAGQPEEWICTVSITSFDPETNTYSDKDPEEMVKFLDKLGR
jgi:hypothetical protein